MIKNFKMYLKLFLSTFYLSAFTFGGGYVIVPLMKKKFVESLRWIKEDEMLDLVSIGQSSPGPIAVNTSILVGYKMAGIFGAVIALFGTVLPPLIVMSIISVIYEMVIANQIVAVIMLGMNAGVAAVIMAAVIQMAITILKRKSVYMLILLLSSFVINYFYGISAIYILLAAAVVGLVITLVDYHYKNKGTKWYT